MHTNYVWLGFLAAAALVVLAYSLNTGRDLLRYYSLRQAAPAHVTNWSVDGQFYVRADYVFESQGQERPGTYLFKQFPSRNRWSAERKIREWQDKEWTAWYNPTRPSVSRLERSFPTKSLISTLVLIAIFLYFVGLGYYVRRWDRPK